MAVRGKPPTERVPAARWRVALLFLFWTVIAGSLIRRASELAPVLEIPLGIGGLVLPAGLTAWVIARRGEFIPSAAAAVAVSLQLGLIALLLVYFRAINPDTPLSVFVLWYGAVVVFFGLPSYWLLVKLPTSGWLPAKRPEPRITPSEMVRGFILFPVVALGVCAVIALIFAGVLLLTDQL